LQHARGCATPNDADESRAGWQTDAAVDAKRPGRPRRADDGTLEARENVCHVLILAIETQTASFGGTAILGS